jgi:hypothetical protein
MNETAIDQTLQQDQTPPPAVEPQILDRARLQGWIPKEEFRGDTSKWISADEFVKRADHLMPILKSVNRKLETKLTDAERRLSEIQGTVEKMAKVQTKYSTDQYETLVLDIRTRKRQAAETGDLALYDQLEQQEKLVAKPEPIEVKPSPPSDAPHPEVSRWVGENSSWFNTDRELTDYAMFVGEQLKRNQDPLAMPGNEYAFCQEVKNRVQRTFPSKFQNPNQRRGDMDESNLRGGENQNTPSGKKTWNDLPTEAKHQCTSLLAQIPGYTKEKYLKDYFEGD